MKISLTPNDFKGLLKEHPEVEMELTESCAKQVADHIARKSIDAALAARLNVILKTVQDSLLFSEGRWSGRLTLNNDAKSIVHAAMRESAEEILREVAIQSLMDKVKENVKKEIEAFVEAQLRKCQTAMSRRSDEDFDAAVARSMSRAFNLFGTPVVSKRLTDAMKADDSV